MEYFYRNGELNKILITTTELELFSYKGISLLAWKKDNQWQVIEASTGLLLFENAISDTKELSITRTKSMLDEYTIEKTIELIKKARLKLNPPKITPNMEVL